MLLSVVLYGSRARGDHRASSDVDLLGLIEQGPIRKEIAKGGTSLYHYPAPLLLNHAKEGNLFVLHLVTEGVILHDTLGVFSGIKKIYEYKSSYEHEVYEASAIIKFFVTRSKLLSGKSARKRLVWAIRTILIARAAEGRQAIFSSGMLANFSGIRNLKEVIDSRHLDNGAEILSVAIKALQRFGSSDPRIIEWPSDKAGQRVILASIGGIAADTLKFVRPAAIRRIIDRVGSNSENPGLAYPD